MFEKFRQGASSYLGLVTHISWRSSR